MTKSSLRPGPAGSGSGLSWPIQDVVRHGLEKLGELVVTRRVARREVMVVSGVNSVSLAPLLPANRPILGHAVQRAPMYIASQQKVDF
jgi:hypothetical protein